MKSRPMLVVTGVAIVLALALFGTVALGIYTGITDGQRKTTPAGQGAITIGSVPATVQRQDSATAAAAPGLGIAQPAPGTFSPGSSPFGAGVAADGLSAWGVAYKGVADSNAAADPALVRAAYQDAEKKAAGLAGATGIKLGKLVALSDYSSNQAFFKPCVQMGVPAPGKPVPQASGSTGSGTSGSGSVSSGPGVDIAPAPCQATGNNTYMVVWVYVRHAL